MTDLALEIRQALSDPLKLAQALGLQVGQRGGGYVLVCCPVHGERHASCSLRVRGGTIGVRCHGCGWTGDALTLVAEVEGLRAFPDVLRRAAELAGRHDLAELVGAPERERPARAPRPAQDTPDEPAPSYPPTSEVEALWGDAGPVSEDADASAHLVGRRIDPDLVARLDLARALHRQTATDRLPRWARYRGAWWRDTGHRMLVRVFDAEGRWQSVRAWRVRDGDSPKRLPPGGHRASGLVLANPAGVAMLTEPAAPCQVVICEGEPDWLVRACLHSDRPVLGVLSGSWSDAFAARIPYGSEVVVRTHLDRAGEKYALDVIRSVRERAQVYRLTPQEPEAA